MKIHVLFLIFAILLLISCVQSPEKILQKSFVACQSVKNGYFETTSTLNWADTSHNSFTCYFKKIPGDSIYSSAFHLQNYGTATNHYRWDMLYTGEDFITAYSKDSSGEIMSKALHAEDIKGTSFNYMLYAPLTDEASYPLPGQSDYSDKLHTFSLQEEEKINGFPCYHIKVEKVSDSSKSFTVKEFWINKADFIPVQYAVFHIKTADGDTGKTSEIFAIKNYALNTLTDESELKLSSIPAGYKLKTHVQENTDLLPNKTTAPGWSLPSLNGEKISLDNMRGKLVLLDFFFKDCAPCVQALPTLQALHEKYANRGLRIVGIDPSPSDKQINSLKAFLSKRGITYPVVTDNSEKGNSPAKNYKVPGFPTLYLIDENGKIIFSRLGYGEGVDKTLEDMIKKNLPSSFGPYQPL